MGQFALRMRYLINRARRISGANLVEFARQSQRVSSAPLPVLIADMLWCSVRYEMAFRDYAVWDVRTLSGRERRTWMTHPKAFRLNKTLNAPSARETMENKPQFYRDFADHIKREWMDVREHTPTQVAAFLERHRRVLAKPATGEGGTGIGRYLREDITDVSAWRDERIRQDQTLIEQMLDQHEQLAALYPGSVNTVRAITYLAPDGTFHLIAGVLRIGNGGVIDNFAGGGMFTMLDDAGTALYPGVDKKSNVYPAHPVTGHQIEGFTVPLFAEAMSLVESLSRRLPEIPYVGWDIAITPDGPAIIEANHNSSVFQMKPSVSGIRTGLLHKYRAAIGEAVR